MQKEVDSFFITILWKPGYFFNKFQIYKKVLERHKAKTFAPTTQFKKKKKKLYIVKKRVEWFESLNYGCEKWKKWKEVIKNWNEQ